MEGHNLCKKKSGGVGVKGSGTSSTSNSTGCFDYFISSLKGAPTCGGAIFDIC
jgi:hypothetical protein